MGKFAVILPAAGRIERDLATRSRRKSMPSWKGWQIWLRAVEPFVNRDDVAQIVMAIAGRRSRALRAAGSIEPAWPS